MQTVSVSIPLLKSLLAFATVIEAKDPCTGGHTWRVSRYSMKLAEDAGLSTDEMFVTSVGGLVHDIGKVGIPDRILNKKDKLTDAEFELIKKHPHVGEVLTRDHPLEALILDVVVGHHEHYDGSGYPSAAAESGISLHSRIVAIADAFDAMTSKRPYRHGLSAGEAYNILIQESGKQFDPALTRRFIEIGSRGDFDHILGHSAEGKPMMNCPDCGPIVVVPQDSRNGDHLVCPGCTGNFVLHAAMDSFEIEWLGTLDPTWVPQPDEDTITEVVRQAPLNLRLESNLVAV